jgi:hypothetical protein
MAKVHLHTNFLEMLINDEEATLIKLNWLCGVKHNVFSSVKMPKRKLGLYWHLHLEEEHKSYLTMKWYFKQEIWA